MTPKQIIEELLEGVKTLNGEYQSGWDEVIEVAEDYLTTYHYSKPIKYSEIAEKQFLELKEETLDEDRHCVGADNTVIYEDYHISVEGFWEKSTWFAYTVLDFEGNLIEQNTIYDV